MTPDELHQILTGRGTFEDHDEVVRVVRPVQQLDDFRHTGTFVRQDGEGDLFWKGVWMIGLEELSFYDVTWRWLLK